MDISSISSAALQMGISSNQQNMTVAIIKMNANQQNAMADLLAQNVQQTAVMPSSDSRHKFSIYA